MDRSLASEQAEPATTNRCLVRREDGDRLTRASDHYTLARFDFFEESRQLRLRFVHVDLLHAVHFS